MISIFCSLPVPLSLAVDVDDPVGVDVEGDLDLRHAARRRRDPGELEFAQALVAGGHLALALEDVDLDRGLVVVGGREDLRLLRRDRRVALDQLRHHAAFGLDPEGQRGDVEQQHVLDVAGQHAGLDAGADGDDLVRVDALVGVLAGQLFDPLADGGHAGHAADQDDVVDRRVGVVERPFDRADDPLQQVGGQLVQLRAAELQVEVLGLPLDGGDEGQVDLRLLRRGELDLRLLGRLVEALQRVLVGREVDALVAFELGDQPLDDRFVPVVAAEVVVAGGRLHLEDAVADFQHGDVEGAAAEVEDEDRLVGFLFVEPVGQRGRGRLVDDPLDVEAGDLAGVLGRLALVVVEVGGDGDHGAVDRFAELRFGVGFQLLQDHRADLRRAVLLAAHVDAHVAVGAGLDLVRDDRLLLFDFGLLAAHEALDREDRVLRVHHRLAFGDRADQALAALGEGDDGRRRAAALGVLEDGGLAALHHRDAGVGRAEVDSDRLCHFSRTSRGFVVQA